MLPIVDLQLPEGHSRLAGSLHESGFAVVVGHGITSTQLNAFYQPWSEFFLHGDKADFKADPATQAGYFSTEEAETARFATAQDLKEYFQFWPGGRLPAALRQITLRLYDTMYELARTVLTALQQQTSEALWEKLARPLPDYLSRPDTMIRVLRYPPLTGREPPWALRAAPHEDINFITLLPAANQSGLQIKPGHAVWQPVDAPNGAIIINIGDMLQELTDHKLPSTTHRVVNPTGPAGQQARITAPLFCHPEPELRLSDQYTAGAYLRERLTEINPMQLKPD